MQQPSSTSSPAAGGTALRQLARNTLWLTGGEIASRLIAFGIAVYLARLIGASGFGLLGASLALIEYFKLFVNGGLDPHGIRDTARAPDTLARVYARVVGLRLAFMSVAVVALLLLLWLMPEAGMGRKDLIGLYGLLLVVEAFANSWALQALERTRVIAAGLLLQHLLMAALIVTLMSTPDADLRWLPLIHVASLLALHGLQYRYLNRRYGPLRPAFDPAVLGPALREAVAVSAGKFLRILYFHGDVLLLAWLSSAAAAGTFLASHKVILSLVMLGFIFQQSVFPHTSRMSASDPLRALRFQAGLLRLVLLAAIPGLVIGGWYATPLMVLLYGEAFRLSGPIFAWMLFTVPLVIASRGLQNLLLVGNHSRRFLLGNGVSALIHLGLGFAWIPSAAGIGAAAACVIAEIGGLLALTVLVTAAYGRQPWERYQLAPLAGGAVMALLLWSTSSWSLPLQLVSALLAYAGTSLLLGAVRPAEWLRVGDYLRQQWRCG